MRFLPVTSLLFLAATSPVFSAPVFFTPASVHNTRATSSVHVPAKSGSSSSSTLGKIATGATVASGVLPFLEDAFHHFFGGGNSTRRDLEAFQELLLRSDDDSEAVSLKTLGKGLSFGIPIISGIASLFEGSSRNSTRRETLEFYSRGSSTDQSDVVSLPSLLDVNEEIVSGLKEYFKGSSSDNNSQQRRELFELIARSNITDDSGALNLGSLFKIGSGLLSGIESLFGGSSNDNQQRDVQHGRIGLVRLPPKLAVARDTATSASVSNSTASEAISFGDIIGDIGSALSLFLKRDPLAQPAGGNSTDSGAINFKDIIGDIGSVLGLFIKRESAVQSSSPFGAGGAPDLKAPFPDFATKFHRIIEGASPEQKRELLQLLARDDDDSEAFSLKNIFNIGKIAADGFSIVSNLFGGSGNSTRRDFIEMLARDIDADDESGALKLKLGDIVNIGSIASDAVSVLKGFFGGHGNSTRRDFEELFARDVDADDESGALKLKLGDLANIGSIASSAVNVFEGLFGSHGNSTRRAELLELLVREI